LVFSDIFFIYIFLPLFLLFYFAARNIKQKNVVLVIFSLAFYAWGEPLCVFLLILTSLLDYTWGRFIDKYRGSRKAKIGLACSVIIDLGILAFFKYRGLIVTAINAVTPLELTVPEVTLPIGISFYTFQSLTYTIDVYRGKAKMQKSWGKYLLYLSMFFQLVAGPIIRYSDVSREIENRTVKISDFSEGLTRFIFGLGKKVIFANNVGAIADQLLGFDTAPDSVLAAWGGVIMYTLQIYFDFSGYSDMAIGMGRMCGFHFPENFNYPYISRSATEFWRRWHISLGSFFRDYVYIPLGGNRKHQMLNILVVWFCTGLWHGANASFILWGLYFGVILIIEKKWLLKALDTLPRIIGHIYSLLVIVVGWTIFYFTDLSKCGACMKTMFGAGGAALSDPVTESALKGSIWLIIAAIILCVPVYGKVSEICEKGVRRHPAAFGAVSAVKLICLLAIILVSSLLLVGDTYNAFLYYRY